MEKLTWLQFKEEVRTRDTAVLPLGATEAHGPHLPLNTDNLIANYLADKFAKRINSFLLPLLPYGQVWSLENFPGSINIREEHLVNFISDIALSLHHHGLKYLVIVNSHLGNNAAIKAAARRIQEISALKVLYLTHPGLKEISARHTQSPWCHPAYMHAEEIETSMVLAIAPELVDMGAAVKEYPSFPPWFDYTPVRWERVTSSGVLGDATVATPEKGEKILGEILDAMEDLYRQFRRDIHGQLHLPE